MTGIRISPARAPRVSSDLEWFPRDVDFTWPSEDTSSSLAVSTVATERLIYDPLHGLFGSLDVGVRGVGGTVVGTGILSLTDTWAVRVLIRDSGVTGAVTYLELTDGAQTVSLGRNGASLVVGYDGGTDVVFLGSASDRSGFVGAWQLLELTCTAGTLRLRVDGVDLSTSLSGSASAFAGACDLHLLNNVAGTAPALGTLLAYVGLSADAAVLDVPPALSGSLAATQWPPFDATWYPRQLESEETLLSLPGGDGPTLVLTDEVGLPATDILATDVETLPSEDFARGLGQWSVHQALRPLEDTLRCYAQAATELTGDVWMRVVFHVDDAVSATQRIACYEGDNGKFGVECDASGNLTFHAPGQTVVAGTVTLDAWHILDLALDRDGGVGGVAKLVAYLDGVDLGLADLASTVADPTGTLRLWDDSAYVGAATSTSIAFFAMAERLPDLARHLLSAQALGLAG